MIAIQQNKEKPGYVQAVPPSLIVAEYTRRSREQPRCFGRSVREKLSGLDCLQHGQSTDDAVKLDHDVETEETDDSKQKDFLYCVECKSPITRSSDRIVINEQHQHTFTNPHGYIYQIGCFAQASGCAIASEATSFFSWFPGYTWQIALCGRCLAHLGWAFRSQESFFFGLILDKLQESA